eukprot:647430-Pelagomonas_calceolata.AAC.2
MQGAAGAWQMKDAHASTMGGIASLAFAAAAAAAAAVVAVAGGAGPLWRALRLPHEVQMRAGAHRLRPVRTGA